MLQCQYIVIFKVCLVFNPVPSFDVSLDFIADRHCAVNQENNRVLVFCHES